MNGTREHTFLFADIAGFTTFTAAHGDHAAADLAMAFCAEVSRLAAAHRAEPIKAIGDAVMVRASTAPRAVSLALAVLDQLSDRGGFPAIRIGMHTGPAVERGGDWFGATVNLAARVAAAARGGEVLVTHDTWRAVRARLDIELERRGPQVFKNVVGELPVYAVAEQRRNAESARPARERQRLPTLAAATART